MNLIQDITISNLQLPQFPWLTKRVVMTTECGGVITGIVDVEPEGVQPLFVKAIFVQGMNLAAGESMMTAYIRKHAAALLHD